MWGDGRGSACADDAAVASGGLDPHLPRPAPGPEAWFAQDDAAVVAALETDAGQGLPQAEAAARLARYGANEIRARRAEVLDIQRAVAPDRAGAR